MMPEGKGLSSDFNLGSAVWNLRDRFTDVSLVCGLDRLRGHKVILAASSPYFSKMLSLRNREEICLPKADFYVLQNLVKFIYTGKAPSDEEELRDFVSLGRRLSVQGLPQLQDEPGVHVRAKEQRRHQRHRSHAEAFGEAAQSGSNPAAKKFRSKAIAVAPRRQPQLSNLPDELLLKILTYVPTFDLIHNVSRVSKHFSKLANDPEALVSINITSTMEIREVQKLLSNKTRVKELRLTGKVHPGVPDWKFLSRWFYPIFKSNEIRVIEFTEPWILYSDTLELLGPVQAKHLTKVKAPFFVCHRPDRWIRPTSIRHLEPNGYVTTDYLLEIAKTSNVLERLKSDCNLEHSDDLTKIFEVNRGHLKEVDLCRYQFTDSEVKSLSFCDQLQGLGMDCSGLAPDSLQRLTRFRNLRLLKVELSEQFFAPSDVTEFLAYFDKLETLSLTYNGTFDDTIFESVARLTQLQDLTLNSATSLFSATNQGFFKVYSRCVNLRRLVVKVPCIIDPEQDNQEEWPNQLPPNLKFLVVRFEHLKLIPLRMMLHRSPALRASIQSGNLYVKADTTYAEMVEFCRTVDIPETQLPRVTIL